MSIIAGIGSLPSFTGFKILTENTEKRDEQFRKDPLLNREIEYFEQNAPKIENVDDFFKDRRLLQYALSAFSMDSEIDFFGRIKKVMTEDLDDEKAVANRLADPRFLEIAEAFDFGRQGVTKLSDPAFLADLKERYIRNEFEKDVGEENIALREALYFKRNADRIANEFDILGDNVFRSVTLTALNIPREIAFQSVETQGRVVRDRVDPADFKDPEFVDKFITRYLTNADLQGNNGGAGGSGDWRVGLLAGAAGAGGGGGGGINLLV